MVLLQFLELIEVFCDHLWVKYLCHAFIMPSTKRNGISVCSCLGRAWFRDQLCRGKGTLQGLIGAFGNGRWGIKGPGHGIVAFGGTLPRLVSHREQSVAGY